MTTDTFQPDDTTGIDCFIYDSAPTTNTGGDNSMNLGEYNAGAQVARILIKFDLSTIPASATITSATLSLWTKTDFSSNARDVKVYRCLRNWVEAQATWNIYSTGNGWGTVGCSNSTTDYDGATVWATTNFSATEAAGTEKQFALNTTEFKKLIDGTYNNYGWLIKMDTETNDMYVMESSGSATAGRRPKLVVVYETFAPCVMIFS